MPSSADSGSSLKATMLLPALQNRTFRLLILLCASLGAAAAVVGTATLSYRQTRLAAIESMEETTEVWTDAISRLMTSARVKLSLLDQTTGGEASAQTAALLRKLVLESPHFREAWLVKDNAVACTDVGVASPAASPGDGMGRLGQVGDVSLVPRIEEGGRSAAIVVNYNPGKDRYWSLAVPVQSISEMMRYGDRKSDHAIFFMGPDGRVLDHSLNAWSLTKPPGQPPASGLSDSNGDLIYTRKVPGYEYSIVAMLPKPVLWSLWGRKLPVYGALAALLAICFFIAAWMATAQTLSLEAELREAARLMQIVAHYQPILDLKTGRCVGMEVLMRWQHPVRGLIPPLAFIPEAERTGLITQLTECMMVRAMNELAPVFAAHPDLHAAINIPVQTLLNPSFPAHVDRLIRGRFSYRNISFELTESTSLTDAALGQLRVMKNLGIRLAVDDFGTGYSNLRYLSLFPFDFLKVDKAFVDGITGEGRSSGLVDQIVSIGRACGMEMIAEGVEHQTQADYLRGIGVEFGQGYLFAAPMTIDKLQAWLDQPVHLRPENRDPDSLITG